MTPQTSELKIDVESPRSWARRLTITVPAERVERERREVARGYARRIRLPGFRKGKVPAHVLERQFGGAIERDAVERVVGEAYREAVQREGLEPITQGEVDDVDYAEGRDLTFHVEFEVQPEIELKRLGGFQVKRNIATVTDAEVDRVLERLREEHAAWRTLEDANPVKGDRVSVEITPLGEEDGGARSYEFVLGEGQALESVEEAIQTLKPGETEEFTVALPPDEESAGAREQRLRIRLHELKRPELPALDDELARSIGDFDTLDELRGRIREDLEREAESEAERELRRELIDRIVEANPFDVPDSMVNRYLERILQPREGADAERVAEMRAQARPIAEEAIKRILVIQRIGEQQALLATPEEVDARVEEIAQRRGRPVGEVWSQLQRSGRLEALEEEITESKVFEFLKSQSEVV